MMLEKKRKMCAYSHLNENWTAAIAIQTPRVLNPIDIHSELEGFEFTP